MTRIEVPPLVLEDVRTGGGSARFSLHLGAGETALIQADDPNQIIRFTELCLGLIRPETGAVRMLGLDWQELSAEAARRLRGRVGLINLQGGWVPQLSVAESVILAALQHGVAPAPVLRDRAAELCRRFGLPGLPLQRPGALSPEELARAACARAFLARPALLILESPLYGNTLSELRIPLLEALATAQPAACIWLTTSLSIWTDRGIPAAQRLHLRANGLDQVRRVAA